MRSEDAQNAPIRALTWIGACALGEAAGLVCAGAINATLVPELVTSGAEPWVLEGLMVVAGGIEGLCLGAAQWLALRRPLLGLRATRHVGASALGMAAGWWLGALAARLEPAAAPGPGLVVLIGAISGLALGVVLGLSQAFVLRAHGVSPPAWIGLNALAWATGMTLSYVGAALVPAGDWDLRALGLGLATGAVVGGVVGAVTRPALPHGTSP